MMIERNWNDKCCKHNYEWVYEQATKSNIDVNKHTTFESLCKETKSNRIQHMLLSAYYLGQARASLMIDCRKDSIVLSGG